MSFPRYPKYKDSGVEWLGKVPEHWGVHRLKRICRVFPSNVDKKSVESEAAVLLCNYTDVYYNDRIVADMEFMPATASDDQIAKFTLRAGDTIITKDSETADDIAVAAYVPNDLPGVVCGYHLSMVRPRQGIDGAFVKRLFDSTYAKSCFAVRANGLTRVGLSQYELDNVDMPVPPSAEQTAIATFLDRETAKIDALIAAQQRLIELLQEKRQAVISHAVTKGLNPDAPMKDSGIEWLGEVPEHWRIRPLKSVISQIEQGWSPQCESYPAEEGEWGVLKVGCVNTARFRPEEQKALPQGVDPLPVYEVREGDILASRGNTLELVGMATFLSTVRQRLLLSDLLYRFRPKPKEANGEYLACALRSPFGRYQIERDAVGTSASMKKVGQSVLRELLMVLPPPEEQGSIMAALNKQSDQLDELIHEAHIAITLLRERRSVLISAAVTGQIDVRGLAGSEAA